MSGPSVCEQRYQYYYRCVSSGTSTTIGMYTGDLSKVCTAKPTERQKGLTI